MMDRLSGRDETGVWRSKSEPVRVMIMKLRHLRISRSPKTSGVSESRGDARGRNADDDRSVRDELVRCKELMKGQRYAIARYESVVRNQRRLVSVCLAFALAMFLVAAFAVVAQWFEWPYLDALAPWLERLGIRRPG